MLGAMSRLTPTNDDVAEGGGYADILQSIKLASSYRSMASPGPSIKICRPWVALVDMVLGKYRS